jgi:hypothetical protein
MKKTKLSLLALSILTLVSCGETTSSTGEPSVSSSTPAAIVESSTTPDSSSKASDIKITCTTTKTEYEVGEAFTIRFTVTGTSKKTLTFALADQSDTAPSVTSSDKKTTEITTTSTSVSLYGKKRGSATLIATSTEDPEVSIEVKLTIVKAVAKLSSVWSNLNKLTNYTLNITRTATSEEINEHDWSDDVAVPVKKIKVTDSVLTEEVAGEVADDLSTTYSPVFTSDNGTSLLGLAADKDGYVSTLTKTSTGYAVADRLTGSEGFTSKSNIAGYGDSATSPNEIYLTSSGTSVSDAKYYSFGGLRVVNSSWFSYFTKDHSNTYELTVDEDDTENTATSTQKSNIAYAKVCLWELIDAQGYMETANTSTSTYFTDLAENVSVTITCNSDKDVSVELTSGSITYTMTISDVDSTTVDSSISTFLGTASSTIPTLASDLQLLETTMNDCDYHRTSQYTVGDVDEYFYKDYYFAHYSDEYKAAYYQNYQKTLSDNGFVLINGKAYSFTYTEGTTGTDGTTTDPVVTISDTPAQTTSGTTPTFNSSVEFLQAMGSYLSTKTFGDTDSGYIYSFTGSDGTYYSTSKAVSDELSYVFLGTMTLGDYMTKNSQSYDSYYTVFQITKGSTTGSDGTTTSSYVSSLKMTLGVLSDDYVYGFNDTIDFKNCASSAYHTAIEAAISAKKAA